MSIRVLQQAPAQVIQDEPGFFQGLIQDISQPVLKAGVTAWNTVVSSELIIRAGIAKLQGDDEEFNRRIIEASQLTTKPERDLGYFGEVKPFESTQEAIGAGVEIGTAITAGGLLKAPGKIGLKRLAIGAGFSGGRAAREGKSAQDIVESAAIGGVISFGLGAMADKIIGTADKFMTKEFSKFLAQQDKAFGERFLTQARTKQLVIDAGKNLFKGKGYGTAILGGIIAPSIRIPIAAGTFLLKFFGSPVGKELMRKGMLQTGRLIQNLEPSVRNKVAIPMISYAIGKLANELERSLTQEGTIRVLQTQ